MSRLAALLLFALIPALPTWAQNLAPAVEIQQAWARATPGGAKTGAVYMTLINRGADEDELVAVATPVAGEAHLHLMSMDNGVMSMRPVPAIDLAPGATVTLGPGGYHVMLTGLRQPLKDGDSFPLTLTFAKSGTQKVEVKVAKIGAMAPDTMGGMQK